METAKRILEAVIVVGGFGAFIDFLIGRTDQARAKLFLLEWSVRFDDIRWESFGRQEGLYAGELIDRWFDPRILAIKEHDPQCSFLCRCCC